MILEPSTATVSIETTDERLTVITRNDLADYRAPVAFDSGNGIVVGRYDLYIRALSQEGLSISGPLGSWLLADPVQGYSGRMEHIPNIASVQVDWGDGQSDDYDPTDSIAHTYVEQGGYTITATVSFGLSYPPCVAPLPPRATFQLLALLSSEE